MVGSLIAQESSPCKDVTYLELKKKKLDEMSDREYQYFLSKDTQCNEYLSSNKNLQSTISSDRINSLRTRKMLDISGLTSIYGITVLGDIMVDGGIDIPFIVIPVIGPFLAFIPSDEYYIEGFEVVLLISGFVQTGFLLDYIKDFKTGVKAELIKDIYKIQSYELDIEKEKVYKTVRIEESLYSEGLKAKIPDSVLMDLVYIYGWDIDFTHDIRPGDSYSLIYEEVLVNGLKKQNGDILIAEFINQGRKHIAIRYELQSGKSEYFSPDGKNVKKAFLRSPVKFSYISSRYDLKRKHPILHKIRAHTGVDYVAQRSSPVRATGDGTVVFSSRKGGYGNVVEIKHSEDYSTRYAHLNRFHSRAKLNRKVKQGQIIGYVGSTGMATGPHLHYEFHVNGKHTDPLKVKFPNANPIDSRERSKYLKHSETLVSVLRNYQSLNHLGYNL